MRSKFQQIFWHYIVFILWGVSAFLVTRLFPPIPLGLMLAIFFIILGPGFLLTRIFRINLGDRLSQMILFMSLGFIYTWFLGFLAISIGLMLQTLTIIWLILLVAMFILGLYLEIYRPEKTDSKSWLKFKDLFNFQNLIYLLVFAIAFLIIMYLVRIGALSQGGDTNYHLATIRKVIGGEPLTIHNLNYARDKMMIVYGFPVWHIFLGLVVKLANSNIFIVWRDMAATLLGMSMLVWYWLSRRILPTRDLAVIAFLIFALIGFYWGPAFVYSSFSIPHTFTQLFLLPLSVGLVLAYAFDKPDKKLLYIILALILTGAAVHITFYFYLLTVLVSLVCFYAIFAWSQPDYKQVIKRLLLLAGLQIAIVIPLALGLEIKGHAVSNYFKIFQNPTYPTDVKYDSLEEFSEFALYAYVGLPLVLAFLKRYQKLIIILAVLTIIIIIYFTPLQAFLARIVGFVYLKRLYGNLDWNFLVWALLTGFALTLVDRLITKLSSLGKFYRWAVNLIIGATAIFLYYWQERTEWANNVWKNLFDGRSYDWLAENYVWLLIASICFSLIVFVWQTIKPKKFDFLKLEEAKNPLARFFLISLMVLIFIAPEWGLFKTYLFQKSGPEFFWRDMTPVAEYRTTNFSNYVGGKEIPVFINENIPPKSVFDTNAGYFYLPIMIDQHMPTYHSQADTEHLELYFEETTIARRLEILHNYKIDYLLVKPTKEGWVAFDTYPQYFTNIYDGKYKIYKLNKLKINEDYPEYCPPQTPSEFQDYIL